MTLDDIDENTPEYEVSNIVNDLLRQHIEVWNGNDEIQDMVIEAFMLGVKYWQTKIGENK